LAKDFLFDGHDKTSKTILCTFILRMNQICMNWQLNFFWWLDWWAWSHLM